MTKQTEVKEGQTRTYKCDGEFEVSVVDGVAIVKPLTSMFIVDYGVPRDNDKPRRHRLVH